MTERTKFFEGLEQHPSNNQLKIMLENAKKRLKALDASMENRSLTNRQIIHALVGKDQSEDFMTTIALISYYSRMGETNTALSLILSLCLLVRQTAEKELGLRVALPTVTPGTV